MICILGAGHVGRALGEGWRKAGRDVRYGVPDPAKASYAGLQGVTGVAKAAEGADVVVIATPWAAAENAVRMAGNLAGRIVIDCTNPLTMGPDGLGLAFGFDRSAGEAIQSWAPDAAVFKVFNQTGAENMAHAHEFPQKPVMFIAGDRAGKIETVTALVEALGFEAVHAGPLRNARLLEAYAMLWIELALKRNAGRNFAFALMRRPG